MASTLEKLLSIQGAEDQLTIESLIEGQEGPKQGEEAPAGAPLPFPPTGPGRPHRIENTGIVDPPPPAASPDALETWREAFRIFSRYAPAIRTAAAEDGAENEKARALFVEALEKVGRMATGGGDAHIIAFRVYDMLGDVWQEARRGCTNSQQVSNQLATGSAT